MSSHFKIKFDNLWKKYANAAVNGRWKECTAEGCDAIIF